MGANLEITENGIVSPSTSEIKEAIQTIFTNAFGTDLSLDDATPQGVLIDGLAQLKQSSNSVLLYLANQFNPEVASGIFQDALANLYFIQRKSATHSIVMCRCIGVNGTVLNGIPDENNPTRVPAMAQSTNGDIFECVTGGIIGNPDENNNYQTPGYIDLVFRSAETGPIPCGANTVNKIYQSIVGWDSVSNSASGSVGVEEETRSEFEKRRVESLTLQATGSLGAVQSGIANLNGVEDYKLWENVTDSSVTYRGVTLSPHSIWVCVNSAVAPDEIAEVIYKNKSAGCDTNGSEDCSYTDALTGVSYTFHYDNPVDVDVYIKVLVQSAVPSEVSLEIKQAIWDKFNGVTGEDAAITIGDTVYAGKFFSSLSGIDADIVQIQVSKSSDSGFSNYITFNMNQLPVVGDRPTSASQGNNIIVEVAT